MRAYSVFEYRNTLQHPTKEVVGDIHFLELHYRDLLAYAHKLNSAIRASGHRSIKSLVEDLKESCASTGLNWHFEYEERDENTVFKGSDLWEV